MFKYKLLHILKLISNKKYNNQVQISLIKQSPFFDEQWYLEQNPDIKSIKISAAEHYLKFGWKEGRNPSINFDTNDYLQKYPDVKQANVNPLYHYERFGKYENRVVKQIVSKINNPSTKIKLKKDYFFSIIVASYNYQDYIKETLDSLIKQTYKNFEVIVVDDGSQDDSVKVIKEYTNKYPFIHLYQHSGGVNKGLPETVYLGVTKAKGEYIAFCESDDTWEPNHLKLVNKEINSNGNVQIIVNDVNTFGDENRCREMAKVIDLRKNTILTQEGKISDEQFSICNYIITFSACCVQKKLLLTCNFLDVPKRTALDWWLWRQINLNNKIYYINKKITNWRLHFSYNIRDIKSETEKDEEFNLQLNKLISKRQYSSIYEKNQKLSDISTFTSIQNSAKKQDIIQQVSRGDFSGLKICYISTTGQQSRPIGDGSTRYRCYHPAETLSDKGAFVTVVPHSTFVNNLSYLYDIYIFHRPCIMEERAIDLLKDIGKIVIADYDDLIFGNQQVVIQSSIYKNLNTPLNTVTQQFQNNLNMLLKFDYVSVSTENLKREVEAVHPSALVSVIHNFIPKSIIRLSEKQAVRKVAKDKDMLMYCTGTLSHNMDFKEIEDTLLQCLNKDKNLKLYIFGVLSAGPKLLKANRVYFHNVADYWDLFNMMSTSAFTIAPLELPSRFNECKSNVKFLESSIAGATLLATPIGDMKRVKNSAIKLCETISDWEKAILNRKQIDIEKNILNNFNYVVENCSTATFINEFRTIFNKEEL